MVRIGAVLRRSALSDVGAGATEYPSPSPCRTFPTGAGRKPPPRIDLDSLGSDRKSTRLNSSHLVISYAVFCLKKKTKRTASLPGGSGERAQLVLLSKDSRSGRRVSGVRVQRVMYADAPGPGDAAL